jgi:prepilin-type processing-associated H-X9-DG protein
MRCPSYEHDYDEWAVSCYAGSMGPQCVWGTCGYDPYLSYCDHPKFPPRSSPDNEAFDQQSRNPNRTRGLFSSGGPIITFKAIRDGLSNTIAVGEVIHKEMNIAPLDKMHFAKSSGVDPDDKGAENWWAYGNAGGHWIGSGANSNTTVHTLAPINYRTDYPIACNTYAELALMAHPVERPVSPDREMVEHSYSNDNLARGFKSRHPGGANFAFADGSVHFLSEDIDHWTYQFLGCRNDGIHIEDY